MHVCQFTNWQTCSHLHVIYTLMHAHNLLCYSRKTIPVGPIFRIVYDARSSNIICTAEILSLKSISPFTLQENRARTKLQRIERMQGWNFNFRSLTRKMCLFHSRSDPKLLRQPLILLRKGRQLTAQQPSK